MFGKGLEYWAVLVGMSLYVATRDAEKEALKTRLAKTAASAFLAYGMSDDFAGYVSNNETFAAVIIMGFGLFALDLGTALLMDREFIKDLIKSKLGKGNGN